MKNAHRLAILWLFVIAIVSSSLPSFAAKKSKKPLPQQKESVNNQINPAGETLDELTSRLQKKQSLELRLGTDRVISMEYIPAAKGQPTFLFLPGVNRSLSVDESNAQMLSRMGNGLISFDFSTQPLSVSQLDTGVKPYFLKPNNKITLESLAEETETVAQYFRQKGVTNIIPVSLSFSGSVSPFLKGYPLIIETSPMTSTEATNPELAQNVKILKGFEIFNPFFGPAINRSLIDQAYRKNWIAQVERISQGYNLPKDRANDMVEGYMTMSHAAEGFDWSQIDVPKNTQRAFIIGENEAPALLHSQIETFLRLSRANKNVSFFIVGEAGHIVPTDQPAAYSVILGNILGQQKYDVAIFGGAIFDAKTKEFKPMLREEMEQFLENKINSLPKASPSF